jgi:ribosome-associated protein
MPERSSRTATTTTTPEEVQAWARIAAAAADDKKATDTVLLEVGKVLSITDVFVVTSGTNARQVRTIADEIDKKLREDAGISPLRTEGRRDLTWVLLDYGALVVHVFSDEMRRFYDIERLYRDVPTVRWTSAPPAADQAG